MSSVSSSNVLISFIVPMRVDSIDRIENCRFIIGFLTRNFPASEIIIVEYDGTKKIPEDIPQTSKQVRHIFVKYEGSFQRSASTNIGIFEASNEVICVYDADIVVSPKAIVKASDMLIQGRADIVVPYNGICLDVDDPLKESIKSRPDDNEFLLLKNFHVAQGIANSTARLVMGGTMLSLKKTLVIGCGYNQNMISYGWEDIEFIKRFEKLGYFTTFLKEYSIIHLNHMRGKDSSVGSSYKSNYKEYLKIVRMNRNSVIEYTSNELARKFPGEYCSRTQVLHLCYRTRPTTLLKVKALANRALILIQVHGLRGIILKLVARLKAAN